jgi:CelD/BcsL family acetyltransferase involved in cellulose biosynthesis
MKWELLPIGNFARVAEDWDKLNARNGNNPLLDYRFVSPLLQHFGTGKEKLAVCRNKGEICGFCIIVKNRIGSWQTFQPSQAPIGCWLQDTDCSTEQLALTLRRSLPGIVLLLGVTQQDPEFLPRPQPSKAIATLDYIDTARIAVTGSFDDYWAARGKNLRQNLRRQRNRLARENTVASLSVLTDAAAVNEAIQAYGTLESAGWKAGKNTAIHIDNPQGRFYKAMLESFAETDQTMIFQYHYNDELVATDLCIIGGGSLIILKTTYNETISTSSPAMLMREDAFRHIFNNKIAERIEFYGKVMDWHTKWSDDFRTMYHLNCAKDTIHTLKAWIEKFHKHKD